MNIHFLSSQTRFYANSIFEHSNSIFVEPFLGRVLAVFAPIKSGRRDRNRVANFEQTGIIFFSSPKIDITLLLFICSVSEATDVWFTVDFDALVIQSLHHCCSFLSILNFQCYFHWWSRNSAEKWEERNHKMCPSDMASGQHEISKFTCEQSRESRFEPFWCHPRNFINLLVYCWD